MKRLTYLLTIILVGYLVYDYFKKKKTEKQNQNVNNFYLTKLDFDNSDEIKSVTKTISYLDSKLNLVKDRLEEIEKNLDHSNYEKTVWNDSEFWNDSLKYN